MFSNFKIGTRLIVGFLVVAAINGFQNLQRFHLFGHTSVGKVVEPNPGLLYVIRNVYHLILERLRLGKMAQAFLHLTNNLQMLVSIDNNNTSRILYSLSKPSPKDLICHNGVRGLLLSEREPQLRASSLIRGLLAFPKAHTYFTYGEIGEADADDAEYMVRASL